MEWEEKPGTKAAAWAAAGIAAVILILAVLLIFHVLDVEQFYDVVLPFGAVLNVMLGVICIRERKVTGCACLWVVAALLLVGFVVRMI